MEVKDLSINKEKPQMTICVTGKADIDELW